MSAAQELILSGSLAALAADARELHARATGAAGTATEYAYQCGQKLIEAKAQVSHGEWLPWLKANCPEIPERTARVYMKIKTAVTADLPEPERRKALAAIWGNAPAAHVANNSGENEWYTPPVFTAAACAAMGGIDLDPASCATANKSVDAKRYFDAETDGLAQDWRGRVWMNPPYSQPLVANFCEKLLAEHTAGRVTQACVLVNNGTETAWGQSLLRAASFVCFPASRIRFIDKDGNPSGAPLQGQMIVYLGGNGAQFRKAFSGLGVVLRG